MPSFVKSVLVDAPVEGVFRFHKRPDAFQLLAPAFPPVRIIGRTGMGIEVGTRVELQVGWLGWVGLRSIRPMRRTGYS